MSDRPRLPSRRTTVELGRSAESRVEALYLARGFELVARNVRVGRLEIDLILRRGFLHVVCEVKHRATTDFGDPASAVDRAKQERVRRAAARWLEERAVVGTVRFDVATVVGDPTQGRVTVFANVF